MLRRTFPPDAGLTAYFIGAPVRAYPRSPYTTNEHLVAPHSGA